MPRFSAAFRIGDAVDEDSDREVISLFSHRAAKTRNSVRLGCIGHIYDMAVIRFGRLYLQVSVDHGQLHEEWLSTLEVSIMVVGTRNIYTTTIDKVMERRGDDLLLRTERLHPLFLGSTLTNTPLIILFTTACGNHWIGHQHNATEVATS